VTIVENKEKVPLGCISGVIKGRITVYIDVKEFIKPEDEVNNIFLCN